jgi:hypothetical protein
VGPGIAVLETVSLELVLDVAEPPLSVAACSSEAVSQAPNNKTAANSPTIKLPQTG